MLSPVVIHALFLSHRASLADRLLTFVVFLMVAGAIVRVVFTLHRAQAQAADRERRLSRLVHAAMDAIVTVDEDRRVVACNAAAEAMFGRPEATLCGVSLDTLIRAAEGTDERDDDPLATAEMSVTEAGSLWAVVGRRADGAEFPAEASKARAAGPREPAIVIVRDISVRAAHAQEIERLHRLYSALGAVSHALGSVRDEQTIFRAVCEARKVREVLDPPA